MFLLSVLSVPRGEPEPEPVAMRAHFFEAVRSSGQRGVMLDVGANAGGFSLSVLMQGRKASLPLKLLMFDPQPAFRRKLELLVKQWQPTATFYAAAAWVEEGTTTFYLSRNSRTASLSEQNAAMLGSRGAVVRTLRSLNSLHAPCPRRRVANTAPRF